MKLSLKKGESYIHVNYSDNDFSNNLYCSDIFYVDGEIKTVGFSFEKILKSRANTNSKNDLKDFTNKVDKIETINFSDNILRKSLVRKFKQNEKVLVKVISNRLLEIEMTIMFKNDNEFELKKTSR
ncbi:MAG: hypothetical protein PF694_09735 [Bacteroidetes bacterium]|jgi:hypothetical protein|nr:hypothetical protein [Bacteroidota bacterium]